MDNNSLLNFFPKSLGIIDTVGIKITVIIIILIIVNVTFMIFCCLQYITQCISSLMYAVFYILSIIFCSIFDNVQVRHRPE